MHETVLTGKIEKKLVTELVFEIEFFGESCTKFFRIFKGVILNEKHFLQE